MEEKTRAVGELLAFNPLDAKGLLNTFGVIGVWSSCSWRRACSWASSSPETPCCSWPVSQRHRSREDLLGTTAEPDPAAHRRADMRDRRRAAGSLPRRQVRPPDVRRPNSKLFKQEYVEKAEYYFEKFGPAKAVVLARFIPIVRTFLNPVAGMLGMPARQFFSGTWSAAILWTDGILLAGYALAKQISDLIPPEKIDTYLLPAVLLIVLISAMPIFIEIFRGWRERRRNKGLPAVPVEDGRTGAHRAAD